MIPFETVSHSKEVLLLLGRRIAEIMEEKGKLYTQEFVANGIGISRDTFRAVLKGSRPIYGTEMRRLSNVLKLPVERIRMTDTLKEAEELLYLLDNVKNKNRALTIAKYLSSVAIGDTEKSETLNNLGRFYFISEQFEEAHSTWLEAYALAKQVFEKYNETGCLFHVITNLSISFSQRKEYSLSAKYLAEVERVFVSSPKHAGAICYSKAMIAEHLGDLEGTKQNLYQSLTFSEMTQEPIRVGRAELNIAHFEYKNKNYETAKDYIEKAITHLNSDPEIKRIAFKVYAKLLLKMGERERALEIIKTALKEFSGTGIPTLKAKFYILYSIATRDVQY
ncbi:MAG: tetratricopeptide repeat protein, partial [Tumebacillaceae bacterium]